MKTKHFLFFGFWLAIFVISCNRDEITFDLPTQKLRFSEDTLLLDTVYNQVRSETYAVKVYNTENKDVKIPHIYLEGGTASQYRINVDGKSGVDFTNIPLRKNDSLYIFVEIAPNSSATEAIAEDRIQFETPAAKQHVTLFSVVQDAEFFISTAANPKIISTDETWNNTKAKIIYGDVKLADGKTLTISQGTKVYFHKNSSLDIGKNSTLNVNGDLMKEVILRGDRNDPKYDTIPLNWKGITFQQGAILNMNYAKVFGGTTGIELYKATATIKNSIIHTFQEFGILGINSTINAENLVMNNCGEADLGIFKGGNYNFTHATFANYWSLNSSLPSLAIYATNEYNNGTSTEQGALTNFNFKNCIMYSDTSNAVKLKPTSGQTFNYKFENCLLKYDAATAGFTFDGNSLITNSLKNQDPKFENYFTQKLNLRVKADSPAKTKGVYVSSLPKDIAGVTRTNPSTIGAYQ